MIHEEAGKKKRIELPRLRGGEELGTILPIAKMALFGYCIQTSRRGFVKKIRESFLESCVANGNVGTGVVSPSDKTCGLALSAEADLLVMVSKDGSLLGIPVAGLPYTIQEVLRLNPADHVVSTFVMGERSSFLALTQNGKVFHRERDWLEPAEDAKSQARAILSKARRQAGMRVVGAAAVDEDDWGVALASSGGLRLYRIGDMFSAGSLLERDSEEQILSFVAFSV